MVFETVAVFAVPMNQIMRERRTSGEIRSWKYRVEAPRSAKDKRLASLTNQCPSQSEELFNYIPIFQTQITIPDGSLQLK
jgi:hypothetical protein